MGHARATGRSAASPLRHVLDTRQRVPHTQARRTACARSPPPMRACATAATPAQEPCARGGEVGRSGHKVTDNRCRAREAVLPQLYAAWMVLRMRGPGSLYRGLGYGRQCHAPCPRAARKTAEAPFPARAARSRPFARSKRFSVLLTERGRARGLGVRCRMSAGHWLAARLRGFEDVRSVRV